MINKSNGKKSAIMEKGSIWGKFEKSRFKVGMGPCVGKLETTKNLKFLFSGHSGINLGPELIGTLGHSIKVIDYFLDILPVDTIPQIIEVHHLNSLLDSKPQLIVRNSVLHQYFGQ